MPTVASTSTTTFAPPSSASGASHQLRALAALSGSLTDALTPELAADLVEQKALSALGATGAIVVTLGAFPPPVGVDPALAQPTPRLHVVHAIGLPAELKAALDAQPLDAPLPFAEVARDGEPLFLASDEALLRYPAWGSSMVAAGAHAAAVVPVWANGELRGVLGLSWPAPHTFDEDECAFVLTLGVMCAQAIMRAHLKQAEREARVSAERANMSKANFVATISHELRTPINAVIGYADILSQGIDGPINAVQEMRLVRMRASGAHLLGLINELLSYARVEAGEEKVRPEPVDLGDIVSESMAIVRPLADLKGLTLRMQGMLEPTPMYSDPLKLRQVLVNIIANGVKFANRGEVVVALRSGTSNDEFHAFIDVSDSGVGIAQEDREHVFDPFWQHDPTSHNTAGSSGLGLSVARTLARLLGGDIALAESMPGKGSTMTISFLRNFVDSTESRWGEHNDELSRSESQIQLRGVAPALQR